MTNPNLVNIGMLRFQNKVSSTLTTIFKSLLYNPENSNQILRVESIVVTNITANAVTIDSDLVRNTDGYSIAKEIEIPAFSTMILIDKDYPLYLKENDAIRAKSSANNALHISINFLEIGETVSTNLYNLGNNFHPASLDIFSWSGALANAATITRDTSTAKSPFGGYPLKMTITGNDPHVGTYNGSQWNIAPAANGQTWEVRVWVKASVATTGQIFIFGVDSSGAFIPNPATAFNAGNVSIGTDWSEVSYSFTFSDAGVAFIQTRLDGTPVGGSGIDIWWDNLQVYKV